MQTRVRIWTGEDPDLLFVLITKDGTPVGSLTVFALHLDTMGGGTPYSADYPGHLEHELRRAFGERFISVFGLGTCGDINHLDVSGRRRLELHLIGQQLAVDVLSARPRTPLAPPTLGAASGRVTLPLRKVSDAQVASARAGGCPAGRPLPSLTSSTCGSARCADSSRPGHNGRTADRGAAAEVFVRPR